MTGSLAPAPDAPPRTTTGVADDGFGLVEIVVSLLVLALLAVALLPLLIQGLKVAAANATLATATQLVQDQLEVARAGQSCAAVEALDGLQTTAPDSRGISYDVTGVVASGACPATFPGIIEITVEVARNDAPTDIITSATTYILVSAAT